MEAQSLVNKVGKPPLIRTGEIYILHVHPSCYNKVTLHKLHKSTAEHFLVLRFDCNKVTLHEKLFGSTFANETFFILTFTAVRYGDVQVIM